MTDTRMAEAPVTPLPRRPNRYRLRRAGIHQVWQFDQVFTFGDGRLLLRGKNGAGKSKAVEILLPFLLDGDIRRFDAAGGSKTTLKWLMLDGWTGGTNRLGYVWIEFGRTASDGEEHRLTVGAAITASSATGEAKPVFFATRLAVGEDLPLDDPDKRPSVAQLRELIGPDNCYDRAIDYRIRVARELFGLTDPGRYRNLVHLLYGLRRPTIGDRIESGELVKVLTEALPPLDDDILDTVARNLDDLDAVRDGLARLEATSVALTVFLASYRRYLHGVLRARVAVVRDELAGLRERRAAAGAAEYRVSELAQEEAAARDEVAAYEQAIAEAEDDLRASAAGGSVAPGDLREKAATVRAVAGAARTAWTAAASAREAEDDAAARLDTDVERASADLTDLRARLREARRQARACRMEESLFGEPVQAGVQVVQPSRTETLHDIDGTAHQVERPRARTVAPEAADALAAWRDRLADAVRAVTDRVRAADTLHRQLAEVTSAEARLREVEHDVTRAEEAVAAAGEHRAERGGELEEAYGAYADAVRDWAATVPAVAPGVDVDPLLLMVAGEEPDPVAVRDLAHELLAPVLAAVDDERDALAPRLGAVTEELKAAREQQRTWRAQADPEPPRPAYATADRDPAAGAPLYLLIDFVGDLDDAARAGLEAALAASGLLSAWVTPSGVALHPSTHDVLLSPAAPAPGSTLADAFRPVPSDAVDADRITALLRTIGYRPTGAPAGPAPADAEEADAEARTAQALAESAGSTAVTERIPDPEADPAEPPETKPRKKPTKAADTTTAPVTTTGEDPYADSGEHPWPSDAPGTHPESGGHARPAVPGAADGAEWDVGAGAGGPEAGSGGHARPAVPGAADGAEPGVGAGAGGPEAGSGGHVRPAVPGAADGAESVSGSGAGAREDGPDADSGEYVRAGGTDAEAGRVRASGSDAVRGRGDCWVAADGRWRLGVLSGAYGKDRAEYIGAGARAATRARKLAELAERIARLDVERDRITAERDALDERRDTLRAALRELPDGRAPIAARQAVEAALAAEERLAGLAGHALREAEQVRSEAVRLRNAALARSSAEDLPTDPDALREVRTSLARLRDAHTTLDREIARAIGGVHDVAAARAGWERAHEARIAAERAYADARADLGRARRELRTLEEAEGADERDALAREQDAVRRRDEARAARSESAARLAGAHDRRIRAEEARTRAMADLRAQEEAVVGAGGWLRRPLGLPGLVTAAELGDLEDRLAAFDAATDGVRARITALRELADDVESRLGPPDDDITADDIINRGQELRDGLAGGYDSGRTEIEGIHRYELLDDSGAHDVAIVGQRIAVAAEQARAQLSAREQEVFERYLLGELGDHLARQVAGAEALVATMNRTLADVRSSHGIGARLVWEQAKDADPEVRTAVDLLRGSPVLRTREQGSTLRDALRRRIESARLADPSAGYASHLRTALDYRAWFSWQIKVTDAHPGRERSLNHRTALSQGEQRVVSYLVLFATAAAHFSSLADAAPDAPRLILLDDAFAKVDEPTHARLLGLLVDLDLDFVLTSERLWGAFPTVPSLHIYECLRDPHVRGVATVRYTWDGRAKRLVSV